ncbi:hypothetical protein [Schlesneria sp. T3-172]|uniref:hypothetical protein n=1 Tax=Schlesneria sphaerica TaxID=3373610 RepID=UPI0037C9ACB6
MFAILRWMFVLVLLIAVVGGGAAYCLYMQSDEGLRQMSLAQLQSVFPNAKLDIAKAQWDLIGRVHMHGVTIQLPEDDEERPSIEIPEVIATLESTALTDLKDVVVQSLRVINPKVRVIRLPAGEWNLQQLKYQSTPGTPLPDVEVVHGTIHVEIQLTDRHPRRLKLQNFNVTATPRDARRLSVQVATLLEPSGPLALDVEVDLDGPKWECVTREAWQVPVDSALLHLLSDISPALEGQLDKASDWIAGVKAKQKTGQRAVPPDDDPEANDPDSDDRPTPPEFGVNFDCDLTFRIAQERPGETPVFRVLAAIQNGQIENELLPVPVQDLRGKILVDNRQIIVSDFQGSNGGMQVSFDGDIIPSKPTQGSIKLRGVELTETIKQRLPENLREIIQKLGVTGFCDIDANLSFERGVWKHDLDLRLFRGTITDKRFPVTVRNVEGELHCQNHLVTFNGMGKYAGQPVVVTGTIKNPGPEHQAEIILKSKNLPLDDESIAACPPDVKRTIEALKLTGRHDVTLKLTKAAGVGQKYKPELIDRIYNGSLNFRGFPVLVTQLQGNLKWNGDEVVFTQVTGMHEGASLAAEGTFNCRPGARKLDLRIDAKDATFYRSLKAALPVQLRKVWDDFQPQGYFDATTKVSWVPGGQCVVILPTVKVRNGEVNIASFPWALKNLNGEFSFNTEPGKLEIKNFQTEHDETRIAGQGMGWFANQKPWQLKFNNLTVDHLIPNATFRNALPAGVKKVYDVLRPTGDFSFSGPVEFFSPPRGGEGIGATWDLTTELSSCAINTGTRVDDISGIVYLKGRWDGVQADLDGELDLNSVSVFRQDARRAYKVLDVRGPFAYHGKEFVAGSKLALPRGKIPPAPQDRIRGKAIGGTIFVDAAVDLEEEEPGYKVYIELDKGLLEQYAKQYLTGNASLAGMMNGWIFLYGRGTDPQETMKGEGKLRIAPAALYELPLFVQMFQMPQLRVPDRTAFAQADLRYTVSNGRFDFQSIDLLGDAMSLRGRGYVRFDGGLALDFGSLPGRGPRRMLQSLFMGGDWVAIRVSGNVSNPTVKYVPFPEVDEAWRQFLGSFNPLQATGGGSQPIPRTGNNPGEPVR